VQMANNAAAEKAGAAKYRHALHRHDVNILLPPGSTDRVPQRLPAVHALVDYTRLGAWRHVVIRIRARPPRAAYQKLASNDGRALYRPAAREAAGVAVGGGLYNHPTL
jgi:hypothetical protein